MKSAGTALVVVIGFFGLIAGLIVLNGVMLAYMWQWFIVPLGVRPIGIAHAIGIAVIVGMLSKDVPAPEDDGKGFERLGTALFARVLGFVIAYGLSFMVPA